jgi:hypothetical protein
VLVLVLLPVGVIVTKALVIKEMGLGDPIDNKMALVDGQEDPAKKLGLPINMEVVSTGPDKGLMPGEMGLDAKKKLTQPADTSRQKLTEPANTQGQKLTQPAEASRKPVVTEPRKRTPASGSSKVIVPAENAIVPALGEPLAPRARPVLPPPKPAVPLETPAEIARRERKEGEAAAERREQIFMLNLKLADQAMEQRNFAKALEFYQEAGKYKRTSEVANGLFLAKLERDQALAQQAATGKKDGNRGEKRAEKLARLKEDGLQALRNNEPARARDAFNQALKLAPDDPVLMQGLVRTEQMMTDQDRKFVYEGLALQQKRDKELRAQLAASEKFLAKERRMAERQKELAERNYRELADKAEQTARAAAAEAQKRYADILRDSERAKREANEKFAALRRKADESAQAAQAASEKQFADLLAQTAKQNMDAEDRLRDVRNQAEQGARTAEAAAKKQYADQLAAAERERKHFEEELTRARAKAAQASDAADARRLTDLLAAAERQKKEADRHLSTLQKQAEQTGQAAADAERKRYAETLLAAEKQRKETEEEARKARAQAEQTARAEADAERQRHAASLLAAERERKEAEKQERQLREQADKTARAAADAEKKRYSEMLRAAERERQEAEEEFKRVLEQPRPSASAEAPKKATSTPAAEATSVPTLRPPEVVVQPKRVTPQPKEPTANELAAKKAQEEADLQNLAKLQAEEAKAAKAQKARETAAAERKRQAEREKALGEKLLDREPDVAPPKEPAKSGAQKSSHLRRDRGSHGICEGNAVCTAGVWRSEYCREWLSAGMGSRGREFESSET